MSGGLVWSLASVWPKATKRTNGTSNIIFILASYKELKEQIVSPFLNLSNEGLREREAKTDYICDRYLRPIVCQQVHIPFLPFVHWSAIQFNDQKGFNACSFVM